MRAFETFVYLDVPKTGSRFIGDVLAKHATARALHFEKHMPVEERHNTEGLPHFISCRDPLDQYLSLYSFGYGGRGSLHNLLVKRGWRHLYDGTSQGFVAWLGVVLDARNARLLGEHYDQSGIAELIGFQTHRFLMLSLRDPLPRLAACRTRDDVARIYRNYNIADFVVRYETLRESLADLIAGPLAGSIADVASAVAYARTAPALNASQRVDASANFTVERAATAAVEEREWFFFEVLGYPRYG